MRAWVWLGGLTLLTVGLSFLALGGEGLAIFNACVANPSCIGSDSTGSLDGFLATVLAGLLLSVAGLAVLTIGNRARFSPS